VTLSVVSGLLLGVAFVLLAQVLPDLLGGGGEHMAGDAALWVIIVVAPVAIDGLLALVASWLLWRGSPVGFGLALLWLALGGLALAITWESYGNIWGVTRMVVVESAAWSVQWPYLVTVPDGASYYASLDDVTFWLPGIVAVGVALVTVCLLGALVAGAREGGRRPA
jgi:hypothetical protein